MYCTLGGYHGLYSPALQLGLGISGIFTLETRNIFSGRVPDTRFVNAIQNARNRELQFANDNVKSAEFSHFARVRVDIFGIILNGLAQIT